MSGLASIGTSLLGSAASLIQKSARPDVGQPVSGAGSLSMAQLYDLRQSFRDGVQQAFQEGRSISDVQKSLESSISAALHRNGIPDSDRQSLLSGLNQLFQKGGTPNELRQQAHQLLSNFVNGMQGPGAATPASVPAAGVGELLDVTA